MHTYILRKLKYSFWCGCNINGASLVAQLVKNLPANAGNVRHGSNPWVRKIPQRSKWQPAPVFLSGKFYEQGSLAGHSPWGCKEWDTKEHRQTDRHTHTHIDTHTNLNGIMLPSSGEVVTSFRSKMQSVTKIVVCAACFIYKYFHRKESFIAWHCYLGLPWECLNLPDHHEVEEYYELNFKADFPTLTE